MTVWDVVYVNIVNYYKVAGRGRPRTECCVAPWERPISSSVRLRADDDDDVKHYLINNCIHVTSAIASPFETTL